MGVQGLPPTRPCCAGPPSPQGGGEGWLDITGQRANLLLDSGHKARNDGRVRSTPSSPLEGEDRPTPQGEAEGLVGLGEGEANTHQPAIISVRARTVTHA